jgi:demethylmenaquinone methyltransferase/2-methoxy-6-polyprenyl-1,4-benzoquinol methylase
MAVPLGKGASTVALDKGEIVDLYRRRSKRYDITGKPYRPLGFRDGAYRRQAVAKPELEEGDTVVELGCGTGMNFPLLWEAVGPRGKIVGVDMTFMMLDVARARVDAPGLEYRRSRRDGYETL